MKKRHSILFHIMIVFYICTYIVLAASDISAQSFRIVATVDETPISNVDLEGRVNLFVLSANLEPSVENKQSVAPQALNSLIDDAIRQEEARRIGFEIKEEELDAGLKQIARQNNLSFENFRTVFSKHFGAWESLEKQIKTQIGWQSVVNRRLRPQVTISEDDIDQQIDDIQNNSGKIEYNIAEIRLNKDANETNEQQIALAQTIYKELAKGASFNALAQQFSEGLESIRGGMVGWVKSETLDPVVADVLGTLSKGDVSKPITTDSGTVILRLNSQRIIEPPEAIMREASSDNGETVEEYRLFQVFVPLPSDSNIDSKRNIALSIAEKAKSCDDMKILSDIYNTPQSGDLGFIKVEDMPDDIRSVVLRLGTNTASNPINKEDGFSIIMICGKRLGKASRSKTADMQAIRNMIANQLGSERLNKLQSQYFQDLKNNAFIDISKI